MTPRKLVVIERDRLFNAALPPHQIDTTYRDSPLFPLKRALGSLLGRRHVSKPFGRWMSDLQAGRKVVFLDSALNEWNLPQLLPHRQHVILFMWNTIKPQQQFIMKYRDQLDIWSHDRSDCQQYGFKFNTTFYAPHHGLTPHEQAHDVVYIGMPKGRQAAVEQIHAQLTDLDRFFHVCVSADQPQRENHGLRISTCFMPYNDYLRHVLASRAVLDVLQPGQDSLTLRAMESIFYEKKLITTYRAIVEEDFYHPDNVYIIDDVNQLDVRAIREFLDKPWHPINPAIVQRYTFESWMSRFE